jgi:hypothetical protein
MGNEVQGSRVSVVEVPSERHLTAESLAKGFGATIFEPAWWPQDVGPVAYFLDRYAHGLSYRIGSTRRGGAPIACIGGSENPKARLAAADWRELPEFGAWRAAVSTGDSGTRAVLRRDEQTLHLIGYASEAGIVAAIKSLRTVTAAP